VKDDTLNRLKVKRGVDLPQSKLTEKEVREMRALNSEYRETVKKLTEAFSAKGLAERYGLHVRTVEKVLSGITWSHIP
jgi:DNA invertase Pin-like site-specific DNA recombinase